MMETILQTPATEPETLLHLLNGFLTKNANESSFVSLGGLETKKSFVSFLLSISLDRQQKHQLRETCLNCLRLVSRESQGMDSLISHEGLEKLFSLIGVGKAESQDEKSKEEYGVKT